MMSLPGYVDTSFETLSLALLPSPSWFLDPGVTISGKEGGAGESILINCELLDSQDQMHVLLYCQFYFELDHNTQNEHQSVLEKA